MLSYFSQLSALSFFLCLAFIAVAISVAALFLVRRFIPSEVRTKDNPVIGNMGALISIIYGVLAGLIALYLINNINFTTGAIQHESNAIASFYRDSKWLRNPQRDVIQKTLKQYLHQVINIEWPLMREGRTLGKDGELLIEALFEQLRHYSIKSNTDQMIIQDLRATGNQLYAARQDRASASATALSTSIWIVIILGAVLTIVINYLFAMNFYMHIVTASAAALMSLSMVFLLVTLDRPFQGDFVIEADVFKPLLEQINHELI